MNYVIGDKLKDTESLDAKYSKAPYTLLKDSDIVIVTDITTNSIELQHFARTDHGINCKNWYNVAEGPALKNFEKRFKKI